MKHGWRRAGFTAMLWSLACSAVVLTACSSDDSGSTGAAGQSGASGTAGAAASPGGGALPGGGTTQATGSPLPVEQLGTPRAIPDDPAQAPDSLFEDTIFDPSKNLTIWVPPGRELRGILLLNGTPTAPSPDDIAQGKKWRGEQAQQVQMAARQMASMWNFALVSGTTWTDANRSHFDEQVKLFEDALASFATQTGHDELTWLPVAIQGGSRFSGFGPGYAQTRPERVIAYVMEVSGAPMPSEESKPIPGLIIPGSDDAGQQKVDSGFFRQRAAGARLAAAMNWGEEHECGSCRDLSWPFLDQVIRLRVPESVDAAGGSVSLLPIQESSGWLGDTHLWSIVYPFADYVGVTNEASWLPSRYAANVWRNYTLYSPVVTFTSPAAPYKWGGGFAQDPSTRSAADPLTIEASVGGAFEGTLKFFDGDVELGEAMISPDGKKATLANVKLEPGLHVFLALSNNRPLSRPAGLLLLP